MNAIVLKAVGFVLIIGLGYQLKRRGLVQKEDSKIFSTLVMNVTLPCSLLASASSITLTEGFYWPLIVGFLANFIMDLVGYLEASGKSIAERGIGMVQIAGYNIGTFTLPFVQTFFPASYLATVLLFDTGNAFMVLGGNYMLATSLRGQGAPLRFKKIVKGLFSSLPLLVYLLTFSISSLGLVLPAEIVDVARIAGNANPFLAMLMLGILVEIDLEKQQWRRLAKLLGIRVGMSLLLALLVYFFLPLPLLVRQMMMICFCSPISVLSPVYALKLGSRDSEAANLNSLCILASLGLMLVLVLLFFS